MHGYSCLAYAYFRPHERARKGETVERDPTDRRDDKLPNNLLYLSAVYANVVAGCGLVSPTVLRITRWVLQLGERDGVDIRQGARYAPLRNVWRMADARVVGTPQSNGRRPR